MYAKPFTMTWQPVAKPFPAFRKTALGEPTAPPVPFIESPELSAMVDAAAAGMSGFLAYGLGKVNNQWSTFWWIVSAATGIKLLHDLSRF